MDIALDYPSRILDYHADLGVKKTIPLGNMSVCRLSDDHFLVSIRRFTYEITSSNEYIHYDGSFEGKNCDSYLAVVDRRFNFVKNVSCQGLEKIEDLRLLRFGDIIQANGTDFYGKGNFKAACIDLKIKNSEFDLEKISKRVFLAPHDKNYVPIEDRRGIFITDMMDGELLVSSTDDLARKRTRECIGLTKYRGSTQLLRYRDGYVSLIHRRERMKFFNAFAFFDRTLQQCRISSEFTVFGNISPINFTCGMVLDGETALLPVCVHDRETHLFELPLADFAKTAHWRS